MSNDSTQKTLIVTLLVCLFCAILVSTAAVILRPAQAKNVELDMKKNILAAAGMLDVSKATEEDINTLFSAVDVRVVDLATGEYSDAVDPATYSPRKAAKDFTLSDELNADDDLAKINRLEKYALVYLVNDEAGNLKTLILPVRGYGLWSTLHGFIALETDLNTVVGFGFYEHGETPGLGGEVDNPRWKALWPGKKVFNAQGEVALGLIKGTVDKNVMAPSSVGAVSGATKYSASPADFQVDGLSGATLTSRGVTNLVHFWLGEKGYGSFLAKLKNQ